MNEWLILSPEEVQNHYRIPVELASNSGNVFLGSLRQHVHNKWDREGGWPFVAFLEYPNQPHLMTLQFCTLEHTFWEHPKYDALDTAIGQHLSLNKQGLIEFIEVFLDYIKNLEQPNRSTEKLFVEMSSAEYEAYRMYPASYFPKSVSKNYIYKIDPILNQESPEVITLVKFSRNAANLSKSLFFKLGELQRERLQERGFTYFFDASKARIVLNRQGADELCDLLKAQLAYLE